MEQHSPSIRAQAVALMRQGAPNRLVAEHLNIPRGTVGWWRSEDRKARGERYEQPTDCPNCTGREFDEIAYAYLLGLYLGDGHIVSKTKQHHLSIFCNATQTGLIAAAEEAMRKVMPLPNVSQRHKTGCVEVKSYTRHWTCMFPQHGPGKKHERPIVLEPWQQGIVDAHPWEFVRGLIHSDGCRITNWTTRIVAGESSATNTPGTSSPTSPTTSGGSSPTPSKSWASSGRTAPATGTPTTSPSPRRRTSPYSTPT